MAYKASLTSVSKSVSSERCFLKVRRISVLKPFTGRLRLTTGRYSILRRGRERERERFFFAKCVLQFPRSGGSREIVRVLDFLFCTHVYICIYRKRSIKKLSILSSFYDLRERRKIVQERNFKGSLQSRFGITVDLVVKERILSASVKMFEFAKFPR